MTAIESSWDVDRVRDYIDVFDNNVLLPAFAAAVRASDAPGSADQVKARLSAEANRLMDLSRVELGDNFPHLGSAASHIVISATNQLLAVASASKAITGKPFTVDGMMDVGLNLLRRNWLGSVLMGAYKARDGVDSVAPGRVVAMKRARQTWITAHRLDEFGEAIALMYQQISDDADKYQEALFDVVDDATLSLSDLDQVGILDLLDVSAHAYDPVATPMFKKAVVLGASGAVGAGMTAALAQHNGAKEIIGVDTADWSGSGSSISRVITADVLAPLESPLLEALKSADLVVAALPAHVLCEALPLIAPNLGPNALFVETLSAKLPLLSVLNGLAGKVEVLGIEPMAAPTPSLAGTPVLVMDYGVELEGPHRDQFIAWLREIDCPVLECTTATHGDLVTSMQSLPHACVMAYGVAESRQQTQNVNNMDVPAMLLARMAQLSPETYWEIQTQNEEAPKARHAVVRVLDEIDKWTAASTFEAFAGAYAAVVSTLGPDLIQRQKSVRASTAPADVSLNAMTTQLAFALTLSRLNSSVAATLPFGTPPYRSMVMSVTQLMALGPEKLFALQNTDAARASRTALRNGILGLESVAQAHDREGFYQQLSTTFAALGEPRLANLQSACRVLFTRTVPDFFYERSTDTVKNQSGLEVVCEPF